MIIPRVGDLWEFHPTIGKKHKTKKTIAKIYWRNHDKTGKYCPYIEWSHTPGARYLNDTRVKIFFQKRAPRLIRRGSPQLQQ